MRLHYEDGLTTVEQDGVVTVGSRPQDAMLAALSLDEIVDELDQFYGIFEDLENEICP